MNESKSQGCDDITTALIRAKVEASIQVYHVLRLNIWNNAGRPQFRKRTICIPKANKGDLQLSPNIVVSTLIGEEILFGIGSNKRRLARAQILITVLILAHDGEGTWVLNINFCFNFLSRQVSTICSTSTLLRHTCHKQTHTNRNKLSSYNPRNSTRRNIYSSLLVSVGSQIKRTQAGKTAVKKR